jgi:ATP-dependent Lon protease
MLPVRNRKDFEDIPEDARTKLEFIWLERVEKAVSSSLELQMPANNRSADPGIRHMAE